MTGFKLLLFFLSVCAAMSVNAQASELADTAKPYAHVKRTSIWVSDLDRAIIFYRDVLGFTVELRGELMPKKDSVLIDLFNLDITLKVWRALLSSSTEQRSLFVMEAEGAPEYDVNDKRHSALVIQSDNLESVKAKATAHGFKVGKTHTDISPTTGKGRHEAAIIGPNGYPVLVYQLFGYAR